MLLMIHVYYRHRDTPQYVEESIKGQGLESLLRFIINPDGTFMGNCFDDEVSSLFNL